MICIYWGRPLRLYPNTLRVDPDIQRVEQTIRHFKDSYTLNYRRTCNLKAPLFFYAA